VSEIREWAVNIEATVSTIQFVNARTPEEAEDLAEQEFREENSLSVEDVTAVAVPVGGNLTEEDWEDD
jgi:hypothetical protein